MESPQSVVSPLKSSSVYSEPEKHNLDHFTRNPSLVSKKTESSLGVLEVYIHQARDIQNICIYHKQDVYAKICLTSNPEKSVTTQTINGGGKNPVFNENLWIDVPTIDSSLKCEIYMLSRVRNYLEDQLLGFALVPLSEVLIKNGKLEKEFSLSSNDLFHSPAGFVQLSLSYNGASPDLIAIPPPSKTKNGVPTDSELPTPDQSELDKIEFPDPKIANENQIMVSEYFGLSSESLVSSDTDDQASSENGAPFMSEAPKPDSPPASVSTNGSQCASVPVSSTESCDTAKILKSANQESDSPPKDQPVEGGSIGDSTNKPAVSANFEQELKVVQQDFVDLYMKSMQQFTESLAKMKLPLDMESEQTSSGNSSADQNIQTPNGTRPRVFYGSRAFF